MSARVYILLEIEDGKVKQAAGALRSMTGVRMVDALEGSPNLAVVIQARNRQALADLTNQAIASVEPITQDIQLLPAQNGYGFCRDKKRYRKISEVK
jgi:hypothetical protein